MKYVLILALAALLAACSGPHFIADAPPVRATTETPDNFEMPARFAIVRMVYNQPQSAGYEEAGLWESLAQRSSAMGTFHALQIGPRNYRPNQLDHMLNEARQQRFNYMIVNAMNPSNGSAQVAVYDVASGGLMATTSAVTRAGGQRGFWGGPIRNPTRLNRVTLSIAEAALPNVEALLRGMVERQR